MFVMSRIKSDRITLATLVLVPLLLLLSAISSSSTSPPMAMPGCQDYCGNIPIPYPFGIGPNSNCFLNSWYRVICDTSQIALKFATLNWNYTRFGIITPVYIQRIEITTRSLPSTSDPLLTLSVYSGARQNMTEVLTSNTDLKEFKNLDLRRSPFALVPLLNTLGVIGIGGTATLRDIQDEIVAGCTTVCPDNTSSSAPQTTSCYGIGCCKTSVPTSLDYFSLQAGNIKGSCQLSWTSDLFYDIVESSYFSNSSAANATLRNLSSDASAILQWKLQELPSNVPNQSTAFCTLDTQQSAYYCSCKNDYLGNPYLPQGCQVTKECEKCPDNCVVLSHGTNQTTYGCLNGDYKKSVTIALGLGISFGSICLFIALYGLYQIVKKRRANKQKEHNFKKNGGLLLQQQMSAGEGTIERTKVFTSKDLEKATDNFNENRILGRGGQGTVYKGMLVDGAIVAIKKSKKKVDENQLGQFINEVVILSQVNHRNVVKLLGCCLETEVPLLVYEFVPNGTLYQHIHNPSEDFRITWKMRLQIASECAEAIAYLHSSSSTPVYHRDIKTSNILLDEKYRAKVSDFGISKTLSIDQTHVTTRVQGTFGYMDPEFFQSNQFTDKSDVYSFGVVLLELLTSIKPVYTDSSLEPRSLASKFLQLEENSYLYEIVDSEVLEEARKEELEKIADLAKQCLQMNGKQRPTMKEVATTLQMINSRNRVGNLTAQKSLMQREIFSIEQSVGDGGLLSNSVISSSSDNPSVDTLPLLFSTDSGW